MSSKPATLPNWCTDNVNMTPPDAGRQVTGWNNQDDGISDWDNWKSFWAYKWCEYVRDGFFDGAFGLVGVISPAAIGGTQNDYNPASLATSFALRQDLSADATLNGLQGASAGCVRLLVNIDAVFYLTLAHEAAASTAGYRFALPDGVNVVLPPGGAALVWYDGGTSRWRLLFATPRKVKEISVSGGAAWGVGFAVASNGDVTLDSTGDSATYDVPLPAGYRLLSIDLRVDDNATGTTQVTAEMFVGDTSMGPSASSNGDGSEKTITVANINTVMDAASRYRVKCTISANNACQIIRVTFKYEER